VNTMIEERITRTALTPCGLSSIDYSLNPYRGCGFGCRFCYAPSTLHEGREWGRFLETKVNIPDILRIEVKRKKKGLVWISSVTDPYQPAEERFQLTKRCLHILRCANWPVTIQTRSTLVIRDIDLLLGFEHADVGFSVSTLNEEYRKVFEPFSPPSLERFRAMRILSDRGVRTWVFLGPILPGITGDEIDEIIRLALDSGAKALQYDRLRFKPGVWERISETLPEELMNEFLSAKRDGPRYFFPIEKKIREACLNSGIPIEPAF